MSKFPRLLFAGLAAFLIVTSASAGKYDLGRKATPEEVAAWNIDIRPDGQGLPEGSGTVAQGEEIWTEKCSSCHGDFGEAVDRWPVVAGGGGTLTSDDPVKTVGSYWPYLSTVWDYVNRAMPFTEARSLEPDEVYALTAYILFINDVVSEEDFELSKENFIKQRLPNENGFVTDARPDTPNVKTVEPCMKDCKPTVKIANRARVLDVTPEASETEN